MIVSDCLKVSLCTVVQTNESSNALMRSGWCIMSTWMEHKIMCKDEPSYVSNISFRIGMSEMNLWIVILSNGGIGSGLSFAEKTKRTLDQ